MAFLSRFYNYEYELGSGVSPCAPSLTSTSQLIKHGHQDQQSAWRRPVHAGCAYELVPCSFASSATCLGAHCRKVACGFLAGLSPCLGCRRVHAGELDGLSFSSDSMHDATREFEIVGSEATKYPNGSSCNYSRLVVRTAGCTMMGSQTRAAATGNSSGPFDPPRQAAPHEAPACQLKTPYGVRLGKCFYSMAQSSLMMASVALPVES